MDTPTIMLFFFGKTKRLQVSECKVVTKENLDAEYCLSGKRVERIFFKLIPLDFSTYLLISLACYTLIQCSSVLYYKITF